MIEIKIPSIIKVGGFDYTVEVSESHNKELSANSNWGEHSGMLRRIRISSECSPQQFSQTFMHESLHAIDTVYQDGKMNEVATSALANGLLQVFEQLGVRFIK